MLFNLIILVKNSSVVWANKEIIKIYEKLLH